MSGWSGPSTRRCVRNVAARLDGWPTTPSATARYPSARRVRRALRRVRRAQQRDGLCVLARADKAHADPRLRKQRRLLEAERARRAYNFSEDRLRAGLVRLSQVPVARAQHMAPVNLYSHVWHVRHASIPRVSS